MLRRESFLTLIAAVMVGCLLVCSSIAFGQGRRDQAFERTREVQERHTEGLMEHEGVIGTAVGLDEGGRHAVVILMERPDATDIPTELDGVPTRVVVTGKIYALGYAPPQSLWPAVLGRDRTPPAAPSGLTANAISSSQINLAWKANTESDLSYYSVYRSAFSNGPFSRRASNVKTIAYQDTGLPPSMTYYYQVTAVDKSGNESKKSATASATTAAGPMPTLWDPRPVPIGVSTGHPSITAGTIGCRVKDSSGNRYALSNNHIYANENRASIGDDELQPGPYDGGIDPRDAIGKLKAYQTITFSRNASNQIDAAIAVLNTLGNGWTVGVSTPSDGYGTPSATTRAVTSADVGVLGVQKYGRGSGFKTGTVTAINATVTVQYSYGVARFVGQLVISPGTFSAGGDSGSLIVTNDSNKNPVGLLFAGSSSVTIANPIDAVLHNSKWNLTIDDGS